MKNLLLFAIVASTLILNTQAFGEVLEINPTDKIVFWHPTPALEVSVMDLDEAGGIVSVSLDYDSNSTREQLEELQNTYPGMQIRTVMGTALEAVAKFEIRSANVSSDLPVRQGQVGPYVNSQVQLSRDQVRQLKSLRGSLNAAITLKVPARASYNSTTEVERYAAPSGACEDLNARNVKGLLLAMSNLEKPRSIRHHQTFSSLKSQLVEQCFKLTDSNVNVRSWNELGAVALETQRPARNIIARYLDQKTQTQNFQIQPRVSARID